MPNRDLYLAAYDVTDPERLQAALHVLKGYACGRQKSVFECFLTERERQALVDEVRAVLVSIRCSVSITNRHMAGSRWPAI
ncbi:MAG: CRISPR-associated endonuclease Cas2 [Candidatus Contendobacter sp.]|nr:CRISPR-associated endonuclease Cas2 [Candidatus Contendobacter sp.]